jgi:AraC-like DNA-binding protein
MLSLNQYSALLACALTNGLVFVVLLWLRAYREERKSDFLLGGVILASCLYITDWMLGFMGIHILWNELFFFPYEIGFIIGPLIYFYLKSQLNVDFQFTRRDFWHFVPYLCYLTIHLVVFLQGEDFARQWSDTFYFPYQMSNGEMFLSLFSNLIYLYWSFRLYQHYHQWIPSQFSNPEEVAFGWYRHFIIAFFVAIVITWIINLTAWLGVEYSYTDIWWNKFFVGILIYYLSIKGYSQPQSKRLVFKETEVVNQPQDTNSEGLSVTDLDQWKASVLKAMTQEKAYLDPDLSLSDLAGRLSTYTSLLSGVINRGFGKSFNDFVNEYRVNEFLQRVNDPANAHLTLLGIAYDCGFNSKATFNRVVKKMTGKAPKELAKNQQ